MPVEQKNHPAKPILTHKIMTEKKIVLALHLEIWGVLCFVPIDNQSGVFLVCSAIFGGAASKTTF